MASKARTKAPVGGAKSKKAARLPSVLCSICEDAILDASAKYPGHDAIECEGLCKAWLHRGCAGLSKAAFQLASSSPKPFLCPPCRLVEHASELQTLKSTVNALCEELSALKDYLKGKESQTSPAPTNIAPEPVDDSAIAPAPVTRTDPEYTTERIKKLPHLSFIHDKKFNLVIFGVDECPEAPLGQSEPTVIYLKSPRYSLPLMSPFNLTLSVTPFVLENSALIAVALDLFWLSSSDLLMFPVFFRKEDLLPSPTPSSRIYLWKNGNENLPSSRKDGLSSSQVLSVSSLEYTTSQFSSTTSCMADLISLPINFIAVLP